MIPPHILHHPAWSVEDPHHTLSRTWPQAATGDTCMIAFNIYLCVGADVVPFVQRYLDKRGNGWVLVGPWSPELGRLVARRADSVKAGRTLWKWKDAKVRGAGEGFMRECRN